MHFKARGYGLAANCNTAAISTSTKAPQIWRSPSRESMKGSGMMRGTVEDIAYQLAALAAAHVRRECNNPKACVLGNSDPGAVQTLASGELTFEEW